MRVLRKQVARTILLVGDLVILSASLYLALAVRYLSVPTSNRLATHFEAFVWLFLLWVIIFFIAGLYDRDILLFPETLPQQTFRAQIANSILGIIFFYAVPYFTITPKTNLFIFVVISFGLILFWRLVGARVVTDWLSPAQKTRAVLVAGGPAAGALKAEIGESDRRPLEIISHINPEEYSPDQLHSVVRSAVATDADAVILDTSHQTVRAVLSQLYNLLYKDVRLYQFATVYEQIFDRVPLEHIQHQWFIHNLKVSPHIAYDWLKRGMDIIASTVLLILPTAILLPFIALAIWLEDGGSIFYTQKRIGEEGASIITAKFRSMKAGDSEEITSVGWFLRKTRLDELPQLINVFRGDLSLIGPRPEKPDLVKKYYQEIPYYHARHLVKPGLSGWAQLKHKNPPKYEADVDKTKDKLSYDLYYVKHRSLLLDIKIALRTLQVMVSQSGQ